jgi:hypothetical protein
VVSDVVGGSSKINRVQRGALAGSTIVVAYGLACGKATNFSVHCTFRRVIQCSAFGDDSLTSWLNINNIHRYVKMGYRLRHCSSAFLSRALSLLHRSSIALWRATFVSHSNLVLRPCLDQSDQVLGYIKRATH